MAILLNQTMPDGVPIEMLDAVTDEMDARANPPEGLLVHVHYVKDGRTCVSDVWESEQQYVSFRDTRLMPALQKVAEGRGVSLDAQPETTITEIHAVVRGK